MALLRAAEGQADEEDKGIPIYRQTKIAPKAPDSHKRFVLLLV